MIQSWLMGAQMWRKVGKLLPGGDVDLTVLSSTMVYSEVYNMMVSPDNYKGGSMYCTLRDAVLAHAS